MSTSPTTTARSRRVLAATTIVLVSVALLLEPIAWKFLTNGTIEFGFLQLKLAYNNGVAFSLGDSLPTWVVLTVTAAITFCVGIFAWRTAPTSSLTTVCGLSAVFAGALANVIDRFLDGKVTDYFHTGWWPTFNLADTYITIGVLVIIVGMLSDEKIYKPAPVRGTTR